MITSDATLANGQPSCTTRHRPVRRTDATIASLSSGRIVRRSRTSTSMPSRARFSAALSEVCSILAHVTTVTSRPGRFTSATPSGTTCSTAGTSPLSAYITSLSMNTTGLSSRIEAFSNPLASAGVAGMMTFRPGTWA